MLALSSRRLAATTTFLSLCEELTRMQLQLLRREESPAELAQEAIALMREQSQELQYYPGSATFIPQCLRTSASLLKHARPEDELAALEVLDILYPLADEYVATQTGDVNAASSTLRAVMGLSAISTGLVERNYPEGVRSTAALAEGFPKLVRPSHQAAFNKWVHEGEKASVASVLALLEGSSAVTGAGSRFPPMNAEMTGLLPIKSRVRMEAKMQRCSGARELLSSLEKLLLNRVDAGMCLSTMASTGLYSSNVCNICCSTLYASHPALSSEQLCQIVYALGVLQHRHVHQKFFSSLVEANECSSDAVRRHAMGLAMLQQPPHDEEKFMNGIFMHALRSGRARVAKSPSPTNKGSSGGPHSEAAANRGLYHLDPEWYVDVGHAISCLGIVHHKYRIMTARNVRRILSHMNTPLRCKLLYALGDPEALLPGVPRDLRPSWEAKVGRAVSYTVHRLNDIEPQYGPLVMNALLYSGVRSHARIPKIPQLHADTNPVELLLQTWATSSKARLLQLAEYVEPQHLGDCPSHKITEVVTAMADGCGFSPEEPDRFGPLCAAVITHGGDMTVAESLTTLTGLQRLGIDDKYSHTLQGLMDNLWQHRHDMTGEQLLTCSYVVQQYHNVPVAQQLLDFAVSERET